MASAAKFARPQTISHEVYEHLRNEILTGSLRPGQWLREQEIAESLAISRTPVREAVRRLGQEGLLEISPNRGVRVHELTPKEAVDTYEVRALLEGRAARLAAQGATPEEVVQLHELLKTMTDIPPEDYAAQIKTDNTFHRTVAEIAGNEILKEMIKLLNNRITRVKILTRDTNASTTTQHQHQAIVDAIAAGDPERAEAIMREHVETYKQLVRERLRSPEEQST